MENMIFKIFPLLLLMGCENDADSKKVTEVKDVVFQELIAIENTPKQNLSDLNEAARNMGVLWATEGFDIFDENISDLSAAVVRLSSQDKEVFVQNILLSAQGLAWEEGFFEVPKNSMFGRLVREVFSAKISKIEDDEVWTTFKILEIISRENN